MNKIRELQAYIDKSRRIVFFGGAGVSTESGIPDFRSVDGLYSQKYKYPPETIISHSFFAGRPGDFYDFYRDRVIRLDAKPNAAHLKLAELESAGKLSAVITQNIDGLHQAAGSRIVLELHGSIWRNYCVKCGKPHKIEAITGVSGVPTCDCGGVVRPDVVLYEESLDQGVLGQAEKYLREADLLIVGGTSLVVYPAAGLVSLSGAPLILINKSATSQDPRASLLIQDNIGDVLGRITI
ncbi:MAG: NAD-dependent protein deacylase [Clostridiales bacterium]|nr:NAD-dependent protein deacylase [Clostridiales bacterium]